MAFRHCAADCPEMVVILPGSFIMGSPATESGKPSEAPQHKVTITKPFAVSKFELTFAEWDACAVHGDCPRMSAMAAGAAIVSR
jgi:formylglycine-generating enzyme required for sulfatase activity